MEIGISLTLWVYLVYSKFSCWFQWIAFCFDRGGACGGILEFWSWRIIDITLHEANFCGTWLVTTKVHDATGKMKMRPSTRLASSLRWYTFMGSFKVYQSESNSNPVRKDVAWLGKRRLYADCRFFVVQPLFNRHNGGNTVLVMGPYFRGGKTQFVLLFGMIFFWD